jgi:hypothetical protein
MLTIPTLPKILLIVLVIGVIWWWHRRNQIRRREQAELERNPHNRAQAKPTKPIEDMTQCKVCGAYVPASGTRNCGRKNCPF